MSHQTTEIRRDAATPRVDCYRSSRGSVRERVVGHIGQAHLRTTQRSRYLVLAVLVGALIAALLAVPTAGAAEIVVSNCAQLQHELSSAEKGDVITLATLCTESNSGTAKGSFNLHSTSDLTIQGQSGT